MAASEKSTALFNGHSLFFIQFSHTEDSRTYLDFDKVEDGIESLIRIYESVQINKKKKEGEESETKIEYELSDLLQFVDSLYDLGSMIYSDKAGGYMSHGREWVKAKIYNYLKKCSTAK